jgi:hypothetical protein
LGAFTTLAGAEEAAEVVAEATEAAGAAGAGEAEAVAEAEVFVVLAIVGGWFVYTLYRDVFLSLFTN